MIPRPPTWIRARITPLPNGVHADDVSTTTRPVTVTAEVEVKKAVMNGVQPGSSLANGSKRAIDPTTMIAAKA